MLLKNQPFQTTTALHQETVKFHTLTHGRFKHSETGNVSTIVKRDMESITIKKHCGWQVTVRVGEFGWDRDVIVVK